MNHFMFCFFVILMRCDRSFCCSSSVKKSTEKSLLERKVEGELMQLHDINQVTSEFIKENMEQSENIINTLNKNQKILNILKRNVHTLFPGKTNKQEISTVVEDIRKDLHNQCLSEDIKAKDLHLSPNLHFNVAYNKQTYESSYITYRFKHYLSSCAVDGLYTDNCYYHSQKEVNPWIMIDLQKPYTIAEIRITGRSAWTDRYTDVKIYVSKNFTDGDSFDSYPLFFTDSPRSKGSRRQYIPSTTMCGQFVIFKKDTGTKSILEYIEIEVLALRV